MCRIYVGKEWPSLSANPSNDLRDMANILHRYIFPSSRTCANRVNTNILPFSGLAIKTRARFALVEKKLCIW
jgi:hypothetical protein